MTAYLQYLLPAAVPLGLVVLGLTIRAFGDRRDGH